MNVLVVLFGLLALWTSAAIAAPASKAPRTGVFPENFNVLIPQNVWIKPGAIVSRSGIGSPALATKFHEDAPRYPWVIPENVYIKPGDIVSKNPAK